MLRELSGVQQIKGEPLRRWFYDHDIDLVIWQDDSGEIVSFQLAYDKTLDEHSLSWHRDRGTKHYVVDDGEGEGLSKRTPFLNLNRAADPIKVLDKFLSRSLEMQRDVADFVVARLREMPTG
jgi:hypothetical protein